MATPGLRLKFKRDAGELIEVVDRLGPERRLPSDQRVQRHEPLAVVRFDVEQRQILGGFARAVLRFQNHLILIRRFLDQVEIILRVGVAQQAPDMRASETP